MSDRKEYWDTVYLSKSSHNVSWYQERPDISLSLVARYAPAENPATIDIGGGASTLTDCLLDAGYSDLSVLDISPAGLAHLKERLGARAGSIHWVVADITKWEPDREYDIWHDRAVLHFLTKPADQEAYARALHAALKSGGIAIIAGFAPGGPEKCSGLPIVQHDRVSLGALLGRDFALLETRDETHHTPWNSEQAFRYHVFRRSPVRE